MPALSASEAISPAFERTKQICFRPFRFMRWLKLAVVTLFTGEIATTSCNFSGPGRIPVAHPGPVYTPPAGVGPELGTLAALPVLLLVLVLVALAAVLVLVHTYFWCQFRLTLIDTVLTGECRIRESWDKYGGAGLRMFGFYIALSAAIVFTGVVLLVIPLISAARAGVFRGQRGALGYLLGTGLLLLLLFIAVVAVFWLVVTFLKDFVAPVMALEDAGIRRAWGRVRQIVSADAGGFVVYILFKIVLAIAAAVLFGAIAIAAVMALVVIPLLIVALAVGIALRSSIHDLSAFFAAITLGKIALALVAIMLFVMALAYLFAFISVPSAVFFESYALYFLGSRYEPLGALLLPQPSPAPYPLVPPQAPPDFIPPHPGLQGI